MEEAAIGGSLRMLRGPFGEPMMRGKWDQKGTWGNHNEGDLKGMEGRSDIGCPHSRAQVGASETWFPPLREQQWKYKKAVDEWTNNEGSFSWTLCPYLD